MKFLVFAIAITISLYAPQSRASGPTFGSEFNFTNEELIKASEVAGYQTTFTETNEKAQLHFFEAVLKKCERCKTDESLNFNTSPFYRIFIDDWWFDISLDPGVVEVQMSPSTLAQLESRQDTIQSLIFDTAKEVGLGVKDSAGHLHMGIESSFDGDPLLFRNFVVDWVIHSNIFFRVYNSGYYNSPTISMLGTVPLRNFRKVISLYDQQILKHNTSLFVSPLRRIFDRFIDNSSTIQPEVPDDLFLNVASGQEIKALMSAIVKYVYYITYGTGQPHKYQSLNLSHEATIEMRSLAETDSANQFYRLAKMMSGRLEYLKRLQEPIPFRNLKPSRMNQRLINDYYQYIRHSGMLWDEVSDMLYDDVKYLYPTELENLLYRGKGECRFLLPP